MAHAVATPALAAATRAFAREPRACKTLIAADFGSKTRGSSIAPATRAALGARGGARAATHVLRARVAGGTEWNDDLNGEEHDDEETERESLRAADDDIPSSGEGFAVPEEARNHENRRDDERETRRREPEKAPMSSSENERPMNFDLNDEKWLDDERFGCSPGQLWVNAVASIGATQNPKHAFHASEFLEKMRSYYASNASETSSDVVRIRDGFVSDSMPNAVSKNHTTWFFDKDFGPSQWFLHAWQNSHDTRAAELRFLLEHPGVVGVLSVALGFFCLSYSKRREKTKELKASLLNDGVDLTNVFGDHLETLEYLHTMRKKNALALGIEVCAMRKVETETRYLGVAALRDWREFYGSRGIDLATKDDVKKVEAYVDNLHHLEGCLLGKELEKIKPGGEGW